MLGDTVGASSVMSILKQHFGEDTTFDWIVRPGFQGLFELDPHVKNVYVLESKNIIYQFLFFIRHRFLSYDLMLNLEVNHRLVLLKWIRARKKSGFPFQKITLPSRIHLFSAHQLIARQSLQLNNNHDNALPVSFGSSFEKIKEKLALKKPYLVIALATSQTGEKNNYKAHRNWPISSWNDFFKEAKKLRYQLVIVGTKSDKQHIESQLVLDSDVINAMGKTNLPELITLVQQACAVVTCDTGILHLASATKTPIFALLGPNDAYRHGPFPIDDSLHTVIRSGIACSPCELTPAHKQCRSNICMQLITPEMVCRVIDHKLSKDIAC
jgi:heptosyltransferase-1